MSDIPSSHRFGTWDADHPCDWLHLGNNLRVSVCAYSARANRLTRFAAGDAGLRLGPRALDGSRVEVELAHEGTRVALVAERPTADAVRLHWQALEHGEWGLRFWLMLAFHLGGDDDVPAEWRYNPDSGVLRTHNTHTAVAALGERLPLLATFHADLDALGEEFHRHGYWYLDSRGTHGTLAVLRYNLEEMPAFAVAVACAGDEDAAGEAAGKALRAPPQAATHELQTGRQPGALDAVRDVMSWNTVWDAVNKRPYTCLSRAWGMAKFGGFGVWLDDVLLHALMGGALDGDLERWNLRAVLAGATPAGNLPCLLTGRDAWVDRSQPPIGSLVAWLAYLRGGDRALVEECYPVLLANHRWWWSRRDGNGNGLLEYGTSPIGDGLYRGTALAARDESMMDNSPMHDEARLQSGSWTLDCEDVGLNSLLVLDAQMLAEMAALLGDDDTRAGLLEQASAHGARISASLFDDRRGVFANRLWSGAFVRSITPTSFLPLLAGCATPAQQQAMLATLHDPALFGGDWLLPAVTRDDPAYQDNVYWRGRIWPPLNFLVWCGLRRAGLHDEASRLADNGYRLFSAEWRERRSPENFNADSGEACDQPDTDPFYGWGALLPYLAQAEISDVDPWHGWQVRHTGEDFRLGPLRLPGGSGTLASEHGELRVPLAAGVSLHSNWRGRWSDILSQPSWLCLRSPDGVQDDRRLFLKGLPADASPVMTVAGERIELRDGVALTAPALPPATLMRFDW